MAGAGVLDLTFLDIAGAAGNNIICILWKQISNLLISDLSQGATDFIENACKGSPSKRKQVNKYLLVIRK